VRIEQNPQLGIPRFPQLLPTKPKENDKLVKKQRKINNQRDERDEIAKIEKIVNVAIKIKKYQTPIKINKKSA
jgi:hypothetical protein